MLQALAGLIDVDDRAVTVTGPTVWWGGPLNVEALALNAVRCAFVAADAVSPGCVPDIRSDLVAANFASLTHLRLDGRPATGFAPMSGYFRCTDGWLRTHANFPHHADALTSALGVGGRDGVVRVLTETAADRAESAIRLAGGVAAVERSRAEWEASPQGAAVASEPWIRWRAGDGEHRPRLHGLRVLDFTRVIAGPVATRFLAALGADVLRVDPPHMPELLDQYLDTGAGKRSAVADLNDSETLAEIHGLIRNADVVILGYRPGALARFGLDPEELSAAHPHLAVVHLDAWGDSGPWAHERGFDSVVQAATGIGDVYRHADGAPGALPVQALDHATGYGAAAAALALLRRGGVAHLSLARTAQELFTHPPPTGVPSGLDEPLVDVPSPHGNLRQARPLVGPPRAPGHYGVSPLAWDWSATA